MKLVVENLVALATQSDEEKFEGLNFLMAWERDLTVCFLKKIPVLPLITVSVIPPLLRAMTGLPQAWASSGVRPKSSI